MSKKAATKKPAPARPDDELSLFPQATLEGWADQEEGQLAVDVQETEKEIVIRSAIAGVQPEDLEVSVHNDLLTIRGHRHVEEEKEEGRWLVQECHWGSFSRSLILPSEVDVEKIDAEMKNGVLTVRLPKIKRDRKIKVKDES
jgi:HSP20 family protein